MVNASHFVLEELYESLVNKKNIKEIKDTFEKFYRRYPGDSKLEGLYEDFLIHHYFNSIRHPQYLENPAELKTKLKHLIAVRKPIAIKFGNINNFLKY